jgi:hypothetical protein
MEMKNRKIVLKGLGACLVVSVMLLFTVNHGHAFDQKKTNKIINAIAKKHAATKEAATNLYSAIRRYEREKDGAVTLVTDNTNKVGLARDPKGKRAYWNKAFKESNKGYKDISSKYSKWEKKSKALWKELKKLDQELE